MKRICLTTLVFLGLTAVLSAQVTKGSEAPEQPAKPVSVGDLSPTFWIGGQAITIVGKNFDTGSSGIGYTGDTWVSFNVALVDSHYDPPKKVASKDDPNQWSLSLKLYDLTDRLNSYSSSPEINYVNWGLGVQGYGWHAGFLSQNNQASGLNPGGDTSNSPATALTGANEVLYLGQNAAGSATYIAGDDTVVATSYGSLSGTAYVGYEVPDFAKVYLTGGTRTSDATTVGKVQNAYAGALNFAVSPMGPGSYDEPFTYTVRGDLIGGTGYTHAQGGNPLGFGFQGKVDLYFDDDVFLSPLVAFDGQLDDNWSSDWAATVGRDAFEWKAGGGLQLTLSPKQWVTDSYGELPSQSSLESFENAKIQKFTYIQLVADWARPSLSQKNKDLDLVFRAEEPDGIQGIDDNLGTMVEYRLANLAQANPGTKLAWSTIGRLSYDFSSHTITPYARWYFDSTQVAKVRLGVLLVPLKGTGVEVTYMSANLNSAGGKTDQGRLEVLLELSTDSAFTMIKSMSFN